MQHLFVENATGICHWGYKRIHVFLERPQKTENAEEKLMLDFIEIWNFFSSKDMAKNQNINP